MQHINIKLFAEPGASIELRDAIPVFHRWIQQRKRPELLIDIADYRHVPDGPGVLLIAHEANYSLDLEGSRLGLLYNRKASLDGESASPLQQALESALAAARLIEQEPEFAGKIRFSTDEVQITLNDRLLFPNTESTWLAVEADVRAVLASFFGGENYSINRSSEPRERFRLHATRSS